MAFRSLAAYLQGFSPNVKDIFFRFKLEAQIDRLANADLLYLVTEKFSKIDLHPHKVSNADMGTIFEKLIRKFAELSNETAGEHFTPREVICLMVNLIFAEDDDVLSKPGVVRTIYDPTAGRAECSLWRANGCMSTTRRRVSRCPARS